MTDTCHGCKWMYVTCKPDSYQCGYVYTCNAAPTPIQRKYGRPYDSDKMDFPAACAMKEADDE